jgi:hypothetical protein
MSKSTTVIAILTHAVLAYLAYLGLVDSGIPSLLKVVCLLVLITAGYIAVIFSLALISPVKGNRL